MPRAYYNEIEPFAAQWIRNLIDAGLVAPGDVDERSIEDVRPDDLKGYTQCHFFAGIAVWSHALRRAGWPDDRPVWTGSCPCQPFSSAGKGGGFADERHLWPAWHHLIRELRPPTVFGEQVADKDGLMWLDLVHADVEATGYAFGPVDLCAAGVGAPHRRQRLFFVAHHHHAGQRGEPHVGLRWPELHDPDRRGADDVVAHSSSKGLALGTGDGGVRQEALGALQREAAFGGEHAGQLAVADHAERRSDTPGRDFGDGPDAGRSEGAGDVERCRGADGLDHHHIGRDGSEAQSGEAGWRESEDASGAGLVADQPLDGRREERALGGRVDGGDRAEGRGTGPDSGSASRLVADADGGDAGAERQQRSRKHRQQQADSLLGIVGGTGPTDGFWRAADWLLCRDPDGPRWRPVEPGTFPLVDGAPARVGRLRAYGNAIVAEVAAAFVEAYLEHEAETLSEDLV